MSFYSKIQLKCGFELSRFKGIKKQFKNIAFVGPNPYLFLQHLPTDVDVEKFTFCEMSAESVEKSYELIVDRVQEGGFYDNLGVNAP